MQLPDESENRMEINIVPMIDVIFSILAFFIISSLYLTRSEGLPVNLPSASTGQSQPSTKVTVTIESDGNIALNRQPVELSELETKVRSLVEPNSETLVIVNADEKVDHGQVIAVMDSLRNVEGAKLAIATQEP
ncbi:ExbD/TolR family protein [Oscillatoria salina]|uniref:ExbD/TolR family protein n=1 Tax=Oscillatoria salina TaxID=331517 RepID=UPI0013B6AD8D|nr:biopolymer transporter ExbD [Oscillatoria salina]MBZ8179863.1 biopolymer transporter ExbD [Oscillatoria salina IIICB1]NET87113.1 biopolymer transporter ExbD [Kamptonema sp. SIO1D9]